MNRKIGKELFSEFPRPSPSYTVVEPSTIFVANVEFEGKIVSSTFLPADLNAYIVGGLHIDAVIGSPSIREWETVVMLGTYRT